MDARKGNQFWKLRSKHGREAIFTDPKKLLESAHEYFESVDERKWIKKDWVGKDAIEVERETQTPYTLTGLCIFLDVNTKYFFDFKETETFKANKDFSEVFTHIMEIIETQQFEGATVGAFNASIIAQKLGLKNNIDITTQGKELKSTIQVEIVHPNNEE